MSARLLANAKAASKPSSAFTPVHVRTLQRCGSSHCPPGQCGTGKKKKRPGVQRYAAGPTGPMAAPSIVDEVLRSPGRPLDPATRASMEPRFGHDFSRVRVHSDAKAAESARSVNALAYTVGRDVVFGAGQYAPGTTAGRRLVAHELTHVVQQGEVADVPAVQARLDYAHPESASEREADAASEALMLEQPPSIAETPQVHVARQMADAGAGVRTLVGGLAGVGARFGAAVDARLAEDEAEKAASQVVAKSDEPVTLEKGKPANPCNREILAEGTCKHLALGSRWVCCDPDNGFKRAGKKTSITAPGEECPSEKWTPLFTCDTTCDRQLANRCDDNDNWMAIPGDQFKRSKCGEIYTICSNGKQTKGYVRDKSITKKSYEVSPGIQKALGVPVGGTFDGAIYRPGAKQAIIDKDRCCKKATAKKPGNSKAECVGPCKPE